MQRKINAQFEEDRHFKPTAHAVLVACALMVGAAKLCLAGSGSQATFPSPEEASRALASAVKEQDEPRVRRILGADTDLISSDDRVQDALERERFVQKYQQMHRWVREVGGIRTLYIGAENWPFPIPLVSRNGVWRFDSKPGAEEIRYRRIGENEVAAIGMCDTLVMAETHPGVDSDADRLVQALLPQLERASKPIAFHGYYFRLLSKAEGRFAVIAYPAVYRSSGVMTFIVTQDGGVREKDLGGNTASRGDAMTHYDSDPTWKPAELKP